MSHPSRAAERGMALVLAIFALVVVGALVAGAFFAGHLEQRTGRSTLYAAQAADAAEAGLAEVLADWDALALNFLAPGTSATLPPVLLAGRAMYHPTVSRLNEQLFLVRSLGTRDNAAGGTLARRTVAIVARLASLGGGPDAALTVGRRVEIADSGVTIGGSDSLAASDEGVACSPGRERPAIRTAAPTAGLFTLFGDVPFDHLKAHAGVVLSDSTLNSAVHPSLVAAGGQCDAGDPSNWGEPRRSEASTVQPCRRYFPIVYATGSRLAIAAGGRGQGILLVEGDLDIAGDFQFTGLIVVRGGIRISGARTRITGAVMAADVAPDDRNVIGGQTTIQFSSCALRQALDGAAFAEPLSQRSWVQVY